jgi:hypothetical protein
MGFPNSVCILVSTPSYIGLIVDYIFSLIDGIRVVYFMPEMTMQPLEFYNFYYFDNVVKLVFVIWYSMQILKCNSKTHI